MKKTMLSLSMLLILCHNGIAMDETTSSADESTSESYVCEVDLNTELAYALSCHPIDINRVENALALGANVDTRILTELEDGMGRYTINQHNKRYPEKPIEYKNDGKIPIVRAADGRDIAAFRLLLEHGANLEDGLNYYINNLLVGDAGDRAEHETPIIFARDLLTLARDKKMEITDQRYINSICAWNFHHEHFRKIAELLLQCGWDPFKKTSEKKSIFDQLQNREKKDKLILTKMLLAHAENKAEMRKKIKEQPGFEHILDKKITRTISVKCKKNR